MKASEILRAMSAEPTLCDEVLGFLSQGMFDEWDCSLVQGLEIGFGGDELQIAARTASFMAKGAGK